MDGRVLVLEQREVSSGRLGWFVEGDAGIRMEVVRSVQGDENEGSSSQTGEEEDWEDWGDAEELWEDDWRSSWTRAGRIKRWTEERLRKEERRDGEGR